MKHSTKQPKPEFDTLQESDKIANAGMPDELAKAIVVALQNAQANLVSTERLENVIDKVLAKSDKSMAKMLAEARRLHREDMATTEARWREERAAEEKRHSENRAADERRHKEDMAARDKQHREDQQRRDKDSERFHRTLWGLIVTIVGILGALNIFD